MKKYILYLEFSNLEPIVIDESYKAFIELLLKEIDERELDISDIKFKELEDGK